MSHSPLPERQLSAADFGSLDAAAWLRGDHLVTALSCSFHLSPSTVRSSYRGRLASLWQSGDARASERNYDAARPGAMLGDTWGAQRGTALGC